MNLRELTKNKTKLSEFKIKIYVIFFPSLWSQRFVCPLFRCFIIFTTTFKASTTYFINIKEDRGKIEANSFDDFFFYESKKGKIFSETNLISKWNLVRCILCSVFWEVAVFFSLLSIFLFQNIFIYGSRQLRSRERNVKRIQCVNFFFSCDT